MYALKNLFIPYIRSIAFSLVPDVYLIMVRVTEQ